MNVANFFNVRVILVLFYLILTNDVVCQDKKVGIESMNHVFSINITPEFSNLNTRCETTLGYTKFEEFVERTPKLGYNSNISYERRLLKKTFFTFNLGIQSFRFLESIEEYHNEIGIPNPRILTDNFNIYYLNFGCGLKNYFRLNKSLKLSFSNSIQGDLSLRYLIDEPIISFAQDLLIYQSISKKISMHLGLAHKYAFYSGNNCLIPYNLGLKIGMDFMI